MIRLPLYQVDAFTSRVFSGNPAGVVPLDGWLPDATLQAIAAENNLAETAFFVPGAGGWDLRWFTPEVEVPLCGHATLASAFVISEKLQPGCREMRFATKSGVLTVVRDGTLLTMDFPARGATQVASAPAEAAALGGTPAAIFRDGDWLMAVYASAAEVAAAAPDMAALKALPYFGAIVTAPGDAMGCDFVSRFFAPRQGIPEDPVTGGAHCMLIPYWAKRLGKAKLRARQISARGGEIAGEDRGARVLMSGQAVLYLEGTIAI